KSVLQRLRRKYAERLAAYRRTGTFLKMRGSPWLPQEEKLLQKHSTRELMAILGRTWESIKSHRRELNIRLRPTNKPWQDSEMKLLGTDRDAAVAERLQRSVAAVKSKRKSFHIPAI